VQSSLNFEGLGVVFVILSKALVVSVSFFLFVLVEMLGVSTDAKIVVLVSICTAVGVVVSADAKIFVVLSVIPTVVLAISICTAVWSVVSICTASGIVVSADAKIVVVVSVIPAVVLAISICTEVGVVVTQALVVVVPISSFVLGKMVTVVDIVVANLFI
jgi:hypothetical protein